MLLQVPHHPEIKRAEPSCHPVHEECEEREAGDLINSLLIRIVGVARAMVASRAEPNKLCLTNLLLSNGSCCSPAILAVRCLVIRVYRILIAATGCKSTTLNAV